MVRAKFFILTINFRRQFYSGLQILPMASTLYFLNPGNHKENYHADQILVLMRIYYMNKNKGC